MSRRLRVAASSLGLASIAATFAVPMGVASAAGRVVEPTSDPVKITYDAHGAPVPFTIKVSGFKPGDLVSVAQCSGKDPSDPTWGVTLDCDTATVPAQASADAQGVVTFPANDPNFGFKPVRGTSPQKFFNCLGPGDADPHNSVPSYTVCRVRIATSFLQRTADETFFAMDFGGAAASSPSADSGSDGPNVVLIVVVVIAVIAIAVATFWFLRRRRLSTR